MSGESGKVFELEMHLNRVKADEIESEKIKRKLEELREKNPEKELRITLIRLDEEGEFGFDLIYEEMPKLDISSCQVEIIKAKRSTSPSEKSSQWVK